MTQPFDLIIRGGKIVDGTGKEAFDGDVGIVGDCIVEVGRIDAAAKQEIDARGMIVTPGFVDVHTHYDGQVTWEHTLKPSTDHGVTTVVIGNCGVGFAPCRAEERHVLVRVMEGVEDIPEIVMTTGIPWTWETFPEFLDFIESRAYDVDIAALVPHAALRVYVMGERAEASQVPTQADLDEMTRLVAEAIRAGAVGVATSHTLAHRDAHGNPAPHVKSGIDELLALAKGLREAGGGIFQIAAGLFDKQVKFDRANAGEPGALSFVEYEVNLLRAVAETSGGPVTFSLLDVPEAPGTNMEALKRVRALNESGLTVKAQTFPRPVGLLVGLEMSQHPFSLHPSYWAIRELTFTERVAKMRDPEFQRRLLSEKPGAALADAMTVLFVSRTLNAYRLGTPPRYDLSDEFSLLHEAKRRNVSPYVVALEWLLENDGHHIMMSPAVNFSGTDLSGVAEMIAHEDVLIGLGDGGAHYGVLCDASYPTTLLTYWVRDREQGRIPVSTAVNMLTYRNAQLFGFDDRGLIAPGKKADINVIDIDRLQLHGPEVQYDLPGGGRRVRQRAEGYVATILNGIITRRDDRDLGVLPGKLLRSLPV